MKKRSIFEFKSIQTKLLLTCLALGIGPLALAGYLSFHKSEKSLIKDRGDVLQVMAETVIAKVDRNLSERADDVQGFAYHPAARGTPQEITAAANHFITSSGNYDLMVVADAEGKVIAASTVDADGKSLNTSFLIGKSVKGEEWFEKSIQNQFGKVGCYFSDLVEDPMVAEVTQSRGLALNYAAPVLDEQGKVIRVWSTRASWHRIGDEIADETRALGLQHDNHWTVQMVSRDGTSILDLDPAAVLKFNLAKSGLLAAKGTVEGKRGFVIEENTRTHRKQMNGFAASKGFQDYPGLGWGVLVRQDIAEATELAHELKNFILGISAVAAVLIVLVAVWVARSIANPLSRTAEVLDRVAEGDLTPRLDYDSGDELGRMATALNRSLESLSAALRGIDQRASSLAGASAELSTLSAQMNGNAEETSGRAGSASSASEEVSASVRTVAAAMEEMAASIQEIARNSETAVRVAAEAVHVAQTTQEIVAKLGTSSDEIGDVVGTITGIASQTNLLALNATIEAARAGEAGKGFAVVATEVKALAQDTAKATEEIGGKVQAIQNDSREAVDAIARIHSTIHKISEFQNSIAGAVQQQTAATEEINRSVAQASMGVTGVASGLTDVVSIASQTLSGALEVKGSSSDLARLGSELRQLVGQFRYEPSHA